MNEELEHEAAEYVLGTLSGTERAAFVQRMGGDRELQAAVAAWEARLSPLAETTPDVVPPEHVWAAVERGISGGAPDTSNVTVLRRRVTRWRGTSAVLGALAAALAVVVVIDRAAVAPPVTEGGRYVAVVDSDGHEPALIAEVDTANGTITLRSLAARAPEGKSLELWHVAEGHDPRSLGVVTAGAGGAQTITNAVSQGPLEGLIAVSVEPEGGSPTGAPTGPVIYTGKLLPLE